MKYLSLLFVLVALSCAYTKLESKLMAKGYNVTKDTTIIKPYEYYIKNKGFTIQYKELHPSKTLDEKISIRGYENADTIPGEVLKNIFKLTFTDTSLKSIISGEIRYKIYGAGSVIRLKHKDIDSLELTYGPFIKTFRKLGRTDCIFFWNINVQKGIDTFTLPSRKYYIKY